MEGGDPFPTSLIDNEARVQTREEIDYDAGVPTE